MSLILTNSLDQFSVAHPPTAFSFVAAMVVLIGDIARNYRVDIAPGSPKCVIAYKTIVQMNAIFVD